MQEVLKTYSNRGVRMGIAHLGSKYIVINFTIACILEVLSHFRYMYMVQQVFVLKVWVISHSHILTKKLNKTEFKNKLLKYRLVFPDNQYKANQDQFLIYQANLNAAKACLLVLDYLRMHAIIKRFCFLDPYTMRMNIVK